MPRKPRRSVATPFSEWLNAALKQRGLDPPGLAQLAGVSPAYVSMLQHGRRRAPSQQVVLALASALGLGQNELEHAFEAAGCPRSSITWPKALMRPVALPGSQPLGQVAVSLQEREKIAEITSSLASRLTVDEVLCNILAGVAEVISFDHGHITLVDWEGKEIEALAHKVGAFPAVKGFSDRPRWPLSSGITGAAATTNRIIRVPDVLTDKRYLEHFSCTRSELAAPLVLQGNVIGVLNLESNTPAHFTARDEVIIGLLAANVAAAVGRAKDHDLLVKKEQEWRERAAALATLHREVLWSRDEATLFQGLASQVVSLFPNFDVCVLRIHDPSKELLLLMGAAHKDRSALLDKIRWKIPLQGSISGHAIRLGTHIIATDVQTDEQFYSVEFASALHLHGMVTVPIPSPDPMAASLGCISCFSTSTAYRFQDKDVRLLEDIAQFIAIALANLRGSLVLSAHRDTSQACRRSPRAKDTLGQICKLARDLTAARGCSIFLLEGARLIMRGTTGLLRDELELASYALGEGKTGWVAKFGRAIRVVDRAEPSEIAAYESLAEMHRFPEDIGQEANPERRGFLAVPIKSTDRTLGVIRLTAKERDLAFTPTDQRLLEAVAEQLDVALEAEAEIANARRQLGELVSAVDVVTLEMTNIRLVDLLKHCVSLNDTQAKLRNISIRIDTDTFEAVNSIRGDFTLLSKAFDNLLRNAVKYSWPDSLIRLFLYGNDDLSCTVCIQNVGIPVEAPDLERIFEPGYRSATARESVPVGTGMGLAIARTIVRRHSGDIRVQSTLRQAVAGVADVRFNVQLPRGGPAEILISHEEHLESVAD